MLISTPSIKLKLKNLEITKTSQFAFTSSLTQIYNEFSLVVPMAWIAGYENDIELGESYELFVNNVLLDVGTITYIKRQLTSQGSSVELYGRSSSADVMGSNHLDGRISFAHKQPVKKVVDQILKQFKIKVDASDVSSKSVEEWTLEPTDDVGQNLILLLVEVGAIAYSKAGKLIFKDLFKPTPDSINPPKLVDRDPFNLNDISVIAASIVRDSTNLFKTYRVVSPEVLNNSQDNYDDDDDEIVIQSVTVEEIDESVKNIRVKTVQLVQGTELKTCRQKATNELLKSRANAEMATASIQGWTGPTGKLWSLGDVVKFETLGLKNELLISDLRLNFSSQTGSTCDLTFKPKDAFIANFKVKRKAIVDNMDW